MSIPVWSSEWTREIEDLVRVDSAVLTKDGVSYAVSVSDARVMSILPDGSTGVIFGRRGGGPGEFTAPFRLHYLSGSDRILVIDGAGRKALVFERDGAFVESWPLMGLQVQGVFFDGGQVCFTNDRLSVDKPNQGVELFAFQLNGNQVNRSVHWQRLMTFGPEQHADPQPLPGQGRNFIRFPWTPRLQLTGSPDGRYLFAGSNVNLVVTVFDVKTRQKIGIIRDELKRQPLTASQIQANLDDRRSALSGSYRASQFEHPDFHAAIHRFAADGEGRLWVQCFDPDRSAETIFRIYNVQGAFLGQHVAPPGSRLIGATEDFVWLTYPDENEGIWLLSKQSLRLKL